MEDAIVVPATGLSEVERVVDTFVAPSKTFTDILRSTSWWLPFLIAVVIGLASTYSIDKKITFESVAEQSIHQSAKSEEQMAQMEPAQRAHQIHIIATSMKWSMYLGFVLLLAFSALVALLNWAGLNFGLGANTTYGQNFAVVMYASLPRMLMGVLNIVCICAGVGTESYDLNNPVGTNLAYYFPDWPQWVRTPLSFFDLFGLWSLALSVIGLAIISRKTKGQAAIVAVGWWGLALLLFTALSALRG